MARTSREASGTRPLLLSRLRAARWLRGPEPSATTLPPWLPSRPVDEQLAQIRLGTAAIVSETSCAASSSARARADPLRIKVGFDPTAPDLHLGTHRRDPEDAPVQDLGHTVYFVIGDFTGLIGDPDRQVGDAEGAHPAGGRGQRPDVSRPGVQDPGPRSGPAWSSTRRGWRRCAREDVIRMTRAGDGRAAPLARGLRDALRGGAPDPSPRVPVPSVPGPGLGGPRDGRARWAARTRRSTSWSAGISSGPVGQEPQISITMPILVGTDGVRRCRRAWGTTSGSPSRPRRCTGSSCRSPTT